MVNNIGTTTQTLSTDLGGTIDFETSDDITIITGNLGLGFLLFDTNGTVGVITEYNETEDETPVITFTVTTYALSLNVEDILTISY